jgi:hypothetical protein
MSKPIRVALSGSGFRLGAHLGALQAVADAGYEVIELAGAIRSLADEAAKGVVLPFVEPIGVGKGCLAHRREHEIADPKQKTRDSLS